jgi:hypothetical protein
MANPQPGHFGITRILVTPPVLGVVVLWTVVWMVTRAGTQLLSAPGMPGGLPLIIWGPVAVPAFGAALPVYALGVFLTWPRAEWFAHH